MKSKEHIPVFKVPQAYFDKLEERIMQKVTLEQLPKNTGMQVPSEYFAQLETRILKNSSNKEVTKKKPKSIRLKNWAYVAAAACVLAFGIWIQDDKPKGFDRNEDLTYNMDIYIEDMVLDMPDSSVLSLIKELDDLDETTPFGYKINKKEIEEYLIENLDLDTLLSYE